MSAVSRCLLAFLCTMFVERPLRAESRVVRSFYCDTGYYYDGVVDQCVPCTNICQPDVPLDFCNNNCPGFVVQPEPTSTSSPERKSDMLKASSLFHVVSTLSTPTQRRDISTTTDNGDNSAANYHIPFVIVVTLTGVLTVSLLVVCVVMCIRLRRRRDDVYVLCPPHADIKKLPPTSSRPTSGPDHERGGDSSLVPSDGRRKPPSDGEERYATCGSGRLIVDETACGTSSNGVARSCQKSSTPIQLGFTVTVQQPL